MKNKLQNKLWLILLVFISLLSCRNEDYLLDEKQQERAEAFFRFSQNNEFPEQNRINLALKKYNEKTNFVAKMGDQIGLPIWQEVGNMKKNDLTKNTLSQKILQTNEEDGTVLYAVPIIEDDYLTSILFTEMKGEEVTEVKNITNDDLWYVINKEEISQEYRESLLLTFLSIDNEVFQTPIYTNIPVGLAGITEDIPNRIRILPKTKTSENGKYMVEYSCVHIIINCTCSSYYNCDRCNNGGQCVTISNCGLTFIDDGIELPSNNGGGSSSGGGGGTGTGTAEGPKSPNQPKDPCANANVFYRLMPSCGGGGLGEVDPVLDDHCEKTKAMLAKPNIQQEITNLKNYVKNQPSTNSDEIGFEEKNDGSVTMNTGGEHYTKLQLNGSKGSYHVHTSKGIHIQSPPDIARIIDFALVQQPTSSFANAYVGIIAKEPCSDPNEPNCENGIKYIHYILYFSGSYSDLTGISFTEDQTKQWKSKMEMRHSLYKSMYDGGNGYMNSNGVEFILFESLKDMGLENKIILQRVEKDGTINNITKGANGTIIATPCP